MSGQLLAACGLARATLPGLLGAFLIFRLLDITKPGPIGWADRQGGAPGIMGDDLIAGVIAAGILWALRSSWPDLVGDPDAAPADTPHHHSAASRCPLAV